MTALRELQRRFKAHLLSDDRAIRDVVAGVDDADIDERLGIYAHAYRSRLRDALRDDFTGLAFLTGDATFDALLLDYIDACPSRHPNIRWLGRALADWLATSPRYPDKPALAEMAALDWALSTSFDAPSAPAVDAAQLAAISPDAWPELRMDVHPTVHRVELHWNVAAIREAGDNGLPRPELHAEPVHTVVTWRRPAGGVRYRRLDDDEAAAFAALCGGERFESVCRIISASATGSDTTTRIVTLLRRWIEAGCIAALRTA